MTLKIYITRFATMYREWADDYAREHSDSSSEYHVVLDYLIFHYQKRIMARIMGRKEEL